jgi:hypothetical protein
VDKFFKTLASLSSRSVYLLAKTKQLAKNIERVSEIKKTLAKLASRFIILLANSEFYLHLASGYPHSRTLTVVVWQLCAKCLSLRAQKIPKATTQPLCAALDSESRVS